MAFCLACGKEMNALDPKCPHCGHSGMDPIPELVDGPEVNTPRMRSGFSEFAFSEVANSLLDLMIVLLLFVALLNVLVGAFQFFSLNMLGAGITLFGALTSVVLAIVIVRIRELTSERLD